mgnify:CR=1 FL=1
MIISKQTQLIRIFSLLLLFLAIGSIGYHYIEGYNWVNSFYMTSVIMSTVGFGGGLNELSEIGRLFTVGLIIFGVSVGAYALTYTAEFIFRNPIIRIRKMAKRISGLKNHYIVCGYGRNGEDHL